MPSGAAPDKTRAQTHRKLANSLQIYRSTHKSFDAVAGEFKQQIFIMLNKSFGIDSVKSVAINLSKIPHEKDDDFGNNTPDVPVANNAFISGV